ncbi:MAG TPA: sugar ABC transporter ATP-binding protein [Spirochaetaceae bacterium]|nr:sugar ABC transporter ATP-binding protein [Spirochaetaceae bacterium]
MATIRIQDITVSYGSKQVLKNLSFSVSDGGCCAILGPSACGKTTIARAVCGFNKLEQGEIFIGDTLVSSRPKNVFLAPEKRSIGVVFQDYAVWPHMTVFENTFYPLKKKRIEKEEALRRARKALEQVQMWVYRDRLPSQLSGGQQQRVAIARALVYDPDLLLLDEPLANLDAKLRRYMRAEIRRIQKATNITTIFVTHDQEEAMAVGDRLAVMRRGIVEQIGSSDELYNKPNSAFVANFIGKMNFFKAELKAWGGDAARARLIGPDFEIEAGNGRNHLPEGTAAGCRILVGARPEQLSVGLRRVEGAIAGKVNIIQHLGQFVRYEVSVDSAISAQPFEVDMPGLVARISEGDDVYVTIKKSLASLYLPEEGQGE